MEKKRIICIFGSSGFLGSELLKEINKHDVKTYCPKIPRPNNNNNLYDFYKKFIDNYFLDKKEINFIINLAGSTNPKTKIEIFFNANFDYILQKFILENNLKTKLLSINSFKIFRPYGDNYSLSKKLANEKYLSDNRFIILYPDLIFSKNNGAYNLIKKLLLKYKFLPLPIFKPGKMFKVIEIDKFTQYLIKLTINDKSSDNKIVVIGEYNVSLYDLIYYVKNSENFKNKFLTINSNFFNLLPKFILSFLFKLYFFQSFDNKIYIDQVDQSKYKIKILKNENNNFRSI